MKEQPEHLTSNISFKTIATQKAEYDKIARSHNLSIGEWVRSIVEMNKYSYGRVGEPSEMELEKDETIKKLQEENELMKSRNEFAKNLNREIEKENLQLKSKVSEANKESVLKTRIIEAKNKQLEQARIEVSEANYRLSEITNNINNMIKSKNEWDFQEATRISDLNSLLVIKDSVSLTQKRS